MDWDEHMRKVEESRVASRVAFVERARALRRLAYPETPDDASCVSLACAMHVLAFDEGRLLALQGGSAIWTRDPSRDDDDPMKGFGYILEDADPDTVRRVMERLDQGLLPELHAWVVDPEEKVLIDGTTGSQPAQCRNLLGLPWLAPAPPDFLWTPFEDIGPKTGSYLASPFGTYLVLGSFMEDGIDRFMEAEPGFRRFEDRLRVMTFACVKRTWEMIVTVAEGGLPEGLYAAGGGRPMRPIRGA